jgi:hypothetical protein
VIVYLNIATLTDGVSPLFSQRHGAKLREDSIKTFGITLNLVSQEPPYGLFHIDPPQDRGLLMQWMNFMKVEAASFEPSDLSRLVGDKIMRVGMESNWNSIADLLTMLQPDELFTNLEAAALRVFSAQPVKVTDNPDTLWLRGQQEAASLAAMKAAGIRDPLEDFNRRDEARARAEAAYQASEDRKTDAFLGIEPEPQPEHLTLNEQVQHARLQIERQNQGEW